MKKTATNNTNCSERIAVDTKGLQELTSLGRDSAVMIGENAKAKITIGRRVLWNVRKVTAYMDSISGY